MKRSAYLSVAVLVAGALGVTTGVGNFMIVGRQTESTPPTVWEHRGMADRRWNHNIHYFPVVLDAVPAGARRALDVGCGEGMLTRRLQGLVPEVVGIDPDRASLDLAQQQNDGIGYIQGDFLTYPFESASFDLISMVATLHHMDRSAAFVRAKELLRPGGVLCVIGLARSQLPRDLPVELASAVAHRFHAWRKGVWQHPSPVQAPSETYADVRRISDEALPGCHFRRRVLWRYSLIWTKGRGSTPC